MGTTEENKQSTNTLHSDVIILNSMALISKTPPWKNKVGITVSVIQTDEFGNFLEGAQPVNLFLSGQDNVTTVLSLKSLERVEVLAVPNSFGGQLGLNVTGIRKAGV